MKAEHMEQRVSLITLGVQDLGQARAFYEGLGWSAHEASNDEVVFFQLPGQAFSLFPIKAFCEDAGLAPPAQGTIPRIALAHNVRSEMDVDALIDKARSLGAHILKPGTKTFWGGYAGYFADVDGHVWEIAFNPFWPLAPDGALTIQKA